MKKKFFVSTGATEDELALRDNRYVDRGNLSNPSTTSSSGSGGGSGASSKRDSLIKEMLDLEQSSILKNQNSNCHPLRELERSKLRSRGGAINFDLDNSSDEEYRLEEKKRAALTGAHRPMKDVKTDRELEQERKKRSGGRATK